MILTIREMEEDDIELIVSYFVDASPDFLRGMGADPNKLPQRADWEEILHKELLKDYKKKEYYYLIWLIDGKPSGHSNINKLQFGKEAYMHLHLWFSDKRKAGLGTHFLQQSIPHFFRNFELERLFCEPYALNPAPNKTLLKSGFEFIHAYETTPGWINFHQNVNRYVMTRKRFDETF